jgi:diguanylate cyclase (GGDEF)-like protein
MKISENNVEQIKTDKKSQALAIAVSALLLLAVSVISLSLWNASESSYDAIAINLSGRQRMLTQRMEKDLLALKFAKQKNADLFPLRQDLAQSYQLFNHTLAMLGEGKLTDSEGNSFISTSTQTTRAVALVIQAKDAWSPIQSALLPVISTSPKVTGDNLEQALSIVMRDNQNLLQLMDSLTGEIENAAHRKSGNLRITEALAIGLILVNFGFVLFYFRRQLTLLSESKLLSMRIIENAGTALVVINTESKIELCNHAAESMFGYGKGNLANVNISTLLQEPYYLQIGKRTNGEHFTLEIELNDIDVSGRKLFIISFYDKTEQKLKEEQLIHRAFHDPLTELPNRILFMDRLTNTVAQAHRKNEMIAVLFIDLDRFKQVNDSLGHAVGDLLLQNVASRLKDCLREGDTLSRLGGDEFTMIIETSDVDVCAIVTKRILSELSREFNLERHNIQISGSIGASLYPNNSSDINLLLHYADIAMYQAKAMGGNTCCKYPEIVPGP